MRILTYEIWESGGVVGARNTDGGIVVSSDPLRILEFLRYSGGGNIRAFWGLHENIATLLKMLPQSVLQSLVDNPKARARHDKYEIYFRPRYSIFGCGRTNFYSLETFFQNEPEPPTLEAVQAKADELASTLADCGLGGFRKLTSPIAIFRDSDWGKEFYESFPKTPELPASIQEAVEYARQCDSREWVTAYQLGHWREGECFEYDLSSAHPSCALDLPHLRDMQFWKSDTINNREWNATMGFLHGTMTLYPDAKYQYCSPIMAKVDGRNCNPAGVLDDYFTLDEVRFVRQHGLGEFRLTDGWFLSPYHSIYPPTPLRDILEKFYIMRSKSNVAAMLGKQLAVQLIGDLIAKHENNPSYVGIRNEIYHATILARTRLKVARFLIENKITKDELICVQTDNCRLTRQVPVPVHNGMGKWQYRGSQPTIVASPVRVYSGARKPYSLTYNDLINEIQKHPAGFYYGRRVPRRTTLRQALELEDISLVGTVGKVEAHLNLDEIPLETNRDFPKLPETGHGLLNNKFMSDPVVLQRRKCDTRRQ